MGIYGIVMFEILSDLRSRFRAECRSGSHGSDSKGGERKRPLRSWFCVPDRKRRKGGDLA